MCKMAPRGYFAPLETVTQKTAFEIRQATSFLIKTGQVLLQLSLTIFGCAHNGCDSTISTIEIPENVTSEFELAEPGKETHRFLVQATLLKYYKQPMVIVYH